MSKAKTNPLTEEYIVHELGNYWVWHKGVGHYEVMRNGVTHSTRCGIVHFPNDPAHALEKAKLECARRQSLDTSKAA